MFIQKLKAQIYHSITTLFKRKMKDGLNWN
jgi:hypothetical protein